MKQYLDQLGVEYLWGRIKRNFAKLGSDGTIPSYQLPSYVDDVLEFGRLSAFPTPGEEGKIYVALDSNLTYRWSGSTYVEISPSIGLGETSSTAYPGDKGKNLADALNSEISRATESEASIRASVTAEQTRALNAEQEFKGLIDKNANDILKEAYNREKADKEITANLDEEKQARVDADAAEKAERLSEDSLIKANLIKEETRAKGVEDRLSSNLSSEISRAKAAEQAEEKFRSDADDSIISSLNTEVSRAKAEEATLSASITTEKNRATAAENDLSAKITTETSRATDAENTLDAKIDSSAIIKVSATDINTAASYQLQIDGKAKGITIDIPKDQAIKDIEVFDMNATLKNDGTIQAGNPVGATALCISYILANGAYKLAKLDYTKFLEETEFADGLQIKDHNVLVKIDDDSESFLTVSSAGVKLAGVQTAIDTSVDTEKAAREAADTELNNLITTTKEALTTSLNSEIERAKGAENTLTTNLNSEITRAKTAEASLQSNMEDEATKRKTADDALTTNLNAEITRAKASEKANADTIAAETTRAKAAEEANANAINAETTRATTKENELNTAISDETTRAKAAEKTNADAIAEHKADTSNPHNVTKALVGLDKVDNTADADKVVASAGKLTTARTIWGQSFDGTTDISGDITLDGAIIISADTQLVDLGLPSGTLWMDRNVGASSPSDYGLYFAWGETDGFTADEVGSKKQFNWDDYNYANGAYSKLTKYCNKSSYGNEGYTDSLVTLETTDDAVLLNAHKYSMPTKEQLQELLDNTTSEWTTQDGVNGRLFTSKTSSHSIFVPAAGYGDFGSMVCVGSDGYLWSSSLKEDDPSCAWHLYFNSSNAYLSGVYGSNRCYGHPVRGVATPAEGSGKTINLPSASGTLALTSDVDTAIDSIPVASKEQLGIAKVGEGLNVEAGVISVAPDYLVDMMSYGVEWDTTVADPKCTRIGNPLFHKSLPVQSQYKGCIVKNGKLQYFLDPNDWTKKASGEASNLDGTDGDVMVRTPRFYGKSGSDGDKRWVRISTIQIDASWVEIPELYVGAYRCTTYKDDDNVTKTASIVNTDAKYRGGSRRTNYDDYLTTDQFRTDLGKPATNMSRATMRTYATAAGQELLCYEFYKWIFYWAYVIEYANFNCQAAYNAELTSDGYHLGGLSAGVTTIGNWDLYNSYNPLTPCGYGNEFGNFTGVKDLVIPAFDYNLNSIWFNSMSANSSTCTSTNSTNNSKLVTAVTSVDDYAFYHNPTSVWGSYTYVISGLTDDQSIIFKEGSSYSTAETKLAVTADGEYTVEWADYNTGGQKWVSFGKTQESCSITIYNKAVNTTVITRAAQTLKMPRWRGFDNPFGDIWANLDGIVIKREVAGEASSVYTTTDASEFGDDISVMNVAGTETPSGGWIKEFDLGETGEIIPSLIGGNESTYKCDYHWTNSDTNKRTLRVGGGAYDGGGAGFGDFASDTGVGGAYADVGFRTVVRA